MLCVTGSTQGDYAPLKWATHVLWAKLNTFITMQRLQEVKKIKTSKPRPHHSLMTSILCDVPLAVSCHETMLYTKTAQVHYANNAKLIFPSKVGKPGGPHLIHVPLAHMSLPLPKNSAWINSVFADIARVPNTQTEPQTTPCATNIHSNRLHSYALSEGDWVQQYHNKTSVQSHGVWRCWGTGDSIDRQRKTEYISLWMTWNSRMA